MKKAKKVNEIWNSNTYAWDREEMKMEYEELNGEISRCRDDFHWSENH